MKDYNNMVTFDLDELINDIRNLRDAVKNYKGEGNLEYTKSNLKKLEGVLIQFDQSQIWRIINFLEEVVDGEKTIMADEEKIPARIETLKRYSLALADKPKDQPIEVFVSQIVDSYPGSLYPSRSKQSRKESGKDSTDKIYKKEELGKISAEELDEILAKRIDDNRNKEKQLSDLERKYELIQKIMQEQKRGAELDQQISEKRHSISDVIKGE